MTKADYDIITVDHWECPEENDARILTQPNIPYPMHSMAPRTVLSGSTWDFMRKKCYMDADYKCELCGGDHRINAHELYSIDYATQQATFVRCICLDQTCHQYGIHTGRALTLYKQGHPLYTAERLLEGAEHTFIIISSWNKAHPDEEPLRVFSAWLDYLKQPKLKEPMDALIKKYDIKFYKINDKWWDRKHWGNWGLLVGNKWYRTPYENWEAWEQAMKEKSARSDDDHGVTDPFAGDIYDEIKSLLT